MDTVFIHGLRMQVLIGVFEWERHLRQLLLLDLEAKTDIKKATRSDRLEDTIDYKTMAHRLKTFAESESFGLLETLAEKMAAIVLEEYAAVSSVKIKLDKPYAVRNARTVGVVVERSRAASP